MASGDEDTFVKGYANDARALGEFIEFLGSIAKEVHGQIEIPLHIEGGCPLDDVFPFELRTDYDKIHFTIPERTPTRATRTESFVGLRI